MARKKTEEEPDPKKKAMIIAGIVIVAVALLTFGAIVAMQALWDSITARKEFYVTPANIALVDPWINADKMKTDFLRTDRTQFLGSPDGKDAYAYGIFQKDLTQRVKDAYLCSPWVRSVIAVRKVFPNRMEIVLDLRTPFAVVQQGAGQYAVDEDGVALSPQVYVLAPERVATLTPIVIVPENVGRPAGGVVWDEPAVQEGIAMIKLCRQQFAGKLPISQVEVQIEKLGLNQQAVNAWIVLTGGVRVQWGRTPRSIGANAEASAPQKVAALLAFYNKEKARLAQFKLIDVRVLQNNQVRVEY